MYLSLPVSYQIRVISSAFWQLSRFPKEGG